MKKFISIVNVVSTLSLFFGSITITQAATVTLNLTRLNGSVAEGTAIFRGDLTSVGFEDLLSITLVDSNSQTGGSNGQYSGFDLDAIKLSNILANTAAEANSALSIDEFDFSPPGTSFNPGSQRPPEDPKLSGTDDSGFAVDPTFATLNSFDAIFFGTGSVTLGDGGSISFNLKNAVSTENLYLYLGEVSGSSGEALDGTLLVSDVPTIPIPATFWLFSSAIFSLARIFRKNKT